MQTFDARALAIIAARKRDILAKLALLSDARSGAAPVDQASAIGHPGDGTQPHHGRQIPGVNGHAYADSSPPPDVDMECVGKDGPPAKTFSLFAHYTWKFDRAAEDANRAKRANNRGGWNKAVLRIDGLCSQALRDLMLYTGEYKRPSADTDAGNVERLLSENKGVEAHEVAVWEMCSVGWVRKSRRMAGVDPDTGEERERDERTLRIVQLREAGMSQRAIAEEVGVGVATVNRALAAA